MVASQRFISLIYNNFCRQKFLLSKCNNFNITNNEYQLNLSRNLNVWEKNIHGTDNLPEQTDLTPREAVDVAIKTVKKECSLFVKETKEHFRQDRKLFQNGDTYVLFRFDKEECLEPWKLGSDRTNKIGNSECKLAINNQGKGVFYGTIDATPPKDGKAKATGFCGMKSNKLKKSFFRQDHYDFFPFTHMEIRLRGDGRSYALNLGMGHFIDLSWLDLYSYYIFTRGGPYWETIRVPFSKFFMTSKGRIQDKQEPFPKNRVDSIGITCATIPGPFRLEIDYIGVHKNENQREEFAYEMYNLPEYIVSLT